IDAELLRGASHEIADVVGCRNRPRRAGESDHGAAIAGGRVGVGHQAEKVGGLLAAAIGSLLQPADSDRIIARDAAAIEVHPAETEERLGLAATRSIAIEGDRTLEILRDAIAMLVT